MTTTTGTRAATLSQVVAANIRMLTAMKGWTQSEVGRLLGKDKTAISDRYRERTPWTLDETEKVAQLLGVELSDLMARPKGFEPLTF